MTQEDITISVASRNINATSICRIHSIKPPKTLFINNIPLTVYVRKGCENDFESTISNFIQNNIKVNIVDNLTMCVKKSFANTNFYNLYDYFEMIELLVVAGVTITKTNKSYILASIGFRSVKDFTFLKSFSCYNYFLSFFRKPEIITLDDELVYKLYLNKSINYNNLKTTKTYEIVLCATLNNQLKYMKKIASKTLEKIINLFFDNKSRKTIIVLKSTDEGISSKIYNNIGFKMTSLTNDGLTFMYKENNYKPIISESQYINPIIINKL